MAVEFRVYAGARDESPEKYGFAHFFEHATPFTSDTTLLKTVSAIRTNSNAQTRKDYTRYYIQIKPGDIELVLRYTAHRLKADISSISDSAIELERGRVLNEMNRQEPKPLYGPSSTATIDAATFGQSHPYGQSNYGSVEKNKLFSTEEVRQWDKKYFFSNNIIVFVTGNFEPEKIKKVIEKEFAIIITKGVKQEMKAEISKKKQPTYITSIPSASNFLSLLWSLPGYTNKDIAMLEVVSIALHERLIKWKPVIVLETGAEELEYRVTIQLWVFAAAGIAALLIAFLTVSIQAARAALSSPIKNLRTE